MWELICVFPRGSAGCVLEIIRVGGNNFLKQFSCIIFSVFHLREFSKFMLLDCVQTSGFLSCHAEHCCYSVSAGQLRHRAVIRRRGNFRGRGEGGVQFSAFVHQFSAHTEVDSGGEDDIEEVKLNFRTWYQIFGLQTCDAHNFPTRVVQRST